MTEAYFPETSAAWRKLKYNLRALMCEKLIHLGVRVSPPGYLPSLIEAVFDAATFPATNSLDKSS